MGDRGKRYESERKKKIKIARMIKETWGGTDRKLTKDPKFIGRIAHTPHSCSCTCCGNPRKHFKEKTLPERRIDDIIKEESEV